MTSAKAESNDDDSPISITFLQGIGRDRYESRTTLAVLRLTQEDGKYHFTDSRFEIPPLLVLCGLCSWGLAIRNCCAQKANRVLQSTPVCGPGPAPLVL